MAGPSRTLRATLAVLLVLVHALLPGFHGLQHAFEDKAHAATHSHGDVCGDAATPSLDRTDGDDHDHAHGDCAICVLLAAGRDALPTGSAPLARTALPLACALHAAPAVTFVTAPAERPPARAPPIS